jgi:hypothetical protein
LQKGPFFALAVSTSPLVIFQCRIATFGHLRRAQRLFFTFSPGVVVIPPGNLLANAPDSCPRGDHSFTGHKLYSAKVWQFPVETASSSIGRSARHRDRNLPQARSPHCCLRRCILLVMMFRP